MDEALLSSQKSVQDGQQLLSGNLMKFALEANESFTSDNISYTNASIYLSKTVVFGTKL